jgi:hypothetical protein
VSGYFHPHPDSVVSVYSLTDVIAPVVLQIIAVPVRQAMSGRSVARRRGLQRK